MTNKNNQGKNKRNRNEDDRFFQNQEWLMWVGLFVLVPIIIGMLR